MKPKIIHSGTRIICLSLFNSRIKFLDSYRFLPLPLRDLPSCFGFADQAKKGTFPFLANNGQYKGYRGPPLPLHYYHVDGMKPKERENFLKYYQTLEYFDFDQELKSYCMNDVHILARACMAFRQLFLRATDGQVDPFLSDCTLPGAAMTCFRRMFLQPNTLALLPSAGYSPHSTRSWVATTWLDYMEQQMNITIEREVRVCRNYVVDGLHKDSKTVFCFRGCFYHVHEQCARPTNLFSRHPLTGKTLFDHLRDMRLRDARIKSAGFKLKIMWECRWKAQQRKEKIPTPLSSRTGIYPPIQYREAYFGGRTEVFRVYHSVSEPGERILALDICSLYPASMKHNVYPLGHPTIVEKDFGPDLHQTVRRTFGFVRCSIVPPRKLFFPVLPYRTAQSKVVFSLCRSCADQPPPFQDQTCLHSEAERMFHGVWTTVELEAAIDRHYVIKEIQELHHFKRQAPEGTLFGPFVNKFLQVKQQASGWPETCHSDAEKRQYLQDYLDKEGIRLDPTAIEHNPGLRLISKLLLNGIFGKFSQRSDRHQVEFLDQPSRLIDLLQDQNVAVHNVIPLTEDMIQVVWKHHDLSEEPVAYSNLPVSIFTCSYGRLKLLKHLESVGERIIYCDTDSLYVITNKNDYIPKTGPYLGDLTNDLKSYGERAFITKWVAIAPKSLAYSVYDPDTGVTQDVVKCKGITLSYENTHVCNFDTLLELVFRTVYGTGQDDEEQASGRPGIITQTQHAIRRPRLGHLVDSDERREIHMITDKRQLVIEDLSTLPFGF